MEKNEVKTSTTITERFTITETIHTKHYPIYPNCFLFSVIYRSYPIERHHYYVRPPPRHELECIIRDEHLVSNEICSDYIRESLCNCKLKPHIKYYIVRKVSIEALNWQNCRKGRKGGYKVEVNVIINVNKEERDGEVISNTELWNAVSCIESGCDNETKKRHDVTIEEIKSCIVHKEVNTKEIQIEYRSVESDEFSFKVNYDRKFEIHHGNLDGHKVWVKITNPRITLPIIRITHPVRITNPNPVTITRPPPPPPTNMDKFEYKFSDQNLIPEEACGDQLIKALLDIDLPSTIQKYLVDYLSVQSVLWDERNGKGIVYEINVKDNVDWWYEVGSCSGDEYACLSRISTTRMAETDCAICLKGLLGEVSRMELPCSLLFHEHCVMTWLKNKSSCPLCRNNVDHAFFC